MKQLVIASAMAAACVFGARGSRVVSLNSIDGGAQWELARQVDVLGVSGQKISSPGYELHGAVAGIVPGTTFAAYVAAGREECPEWGDNIYRVDESWYNRPMWYRTEFPTPELSEGERVWLHFDNTHRYADFYCNGVKLSGTAATTRDVKGHIMRSRFDITPLLSKEGCNAVAVLITDPDQKKKRNSNDAYGVACSPSYMSAAGWDWMPYVPGRLSGITGNAYLRITGGAVIEDPWVRSELLSEKVAELSVTTSVHNVGDEPVEVTLRGVITPGEISFEKKTVIAAGATVEVAFDSNSCRQLAVENPRLWWPNGYGEPDLYTCRLECLAGGEVTDTREVTFGIRKYEYEKVDNSEGYPVWRFKVNGKPVYLKGGNWGISEYLLRCHGKEYETKVRLHKEMNFNMIRLWTGCVTDEEFYDYCDRYGIMVWDDFWLYVAYNEVAEPEVFKANAREKVLRLRNHPCIALWCGANETHPSDELDAYLEELVATEDGGDRMYKSCSNDDGLSGSGWWMNRTPDEYFEWAANALIFGGYRFTDTSGYGLRSEVGMATFPNYESVELFMPEESRWPLPDDETLEKVDDTVWNRHFFGKEGWNAAPVTYKSSVNSQYGESQSLEEFCEKAQLLNIECMKGMFEAWNDKLWNDASGLLIWMSNPAYPSFLWQTYDYYYDTTGAYWGAKQACEHNHIQWNTLTGSVKVVNTSGVALEGVATARVYDIAGKELPGAFREAAVSVDAASNKEVFVLDPHGGATAGIRFVRLRLTAPDGTLLSENTYWHNCATKYAYSRLASMPAAQVDCRISPLSDAGCFTLTLENRSDAVAFATRIRLVNPVSGERILPAIMSDNFVTLLPYETRSITVEAPVGLLSDGVDVMVKQFRQPEFKGASTTDAGIETLGGSAVACGMVAYTPGNGMLTLGWDGGYERFVKVFSPTGVEVVSRLLRPMTTLRLPSGIYIVAAGNDVLKVMVRN